MSELSAMLAGAMLKSPWLMRAVIVTALALPVARVIVAVRGKGASAGKTRVGGRAWSGHP